jgi:fumarate reductase flavoprotein subunit
LVRELAQSYADVDPVLELIPVRPVIHYTMGGIDTDIDAATGLDGLFAAGECACVSINGANRLGSNSLTELLVFGARAGRGAAAHALTAPACNEKALAEQAAAADGRVKALFRKSGGTESVSGLRREMNNSMEEGAGIYRTEESLRESCAVMADIRRRYGDIELADKSNVFNTDLIQTLELGTMIDVAQAIVVSAFNRRESRGSHQRLDHQARDDQNYLKHSLAHYDTETDPQIDYREVVITRSQPAERVYGGDAQ